MTKTLIVGATGNMGKELVKACRAQGHDVHALIRPETRDDADRMKPLEAADAVIHEGDIVELESLTRACAAVDHVVSAIDVMATDEGPLQQAVQEAGVRRFIPSSFGCDLAVARPGSCLVFDIKRANEKKIEALNIPYTFVYANCFFSHWVFSLGDMMQLEGPLPPGEVSVFGDGEVPGAFVALRDVATIVARALTDPAMRDRKLRVTTNAMTQNQLIELWRQMSGRSVATVTVSSDQLEAQIARAAAANDRMTMALSQLHRSTWLRGETVAHSPEAIEATAAYPELELQTVRAGLAAFL